jgi:hypothetical protein
MHMALHEYLVFGFDARSAAETDGGLWLVVV